MKSALFLLNAFALAALVSFHYQSDNTDAAEIHVNAQQTVRHPVAQLAVMGATGHTAALTQAGEPGGNAMSQSHAERFIF